MTHRSVLVWSMAASLLAGCSGGAGSVLSSGMPTNTNTNTASGQSPTHHSQVAGRVSRPHGRSAQFIGANVKTSPIRSRPGRSPGLSPSARARTAVRPPSTRAPSVSPANTYSLAVTLENGRTAVGTGSATGSRSHRRQRRRYR